MMKLTSATQIRGTRLSAPLFRFRTVRELSETVQGGSESVEGQTRSSGASRKHHWEERRRHPALNGDDTARERLQQVSSYYNQSAIDEVAMSISRRVHLGSWYNNSRNNLTDNHIIVNAKYLHTELPVRVAHRIKDFRALPFIVGCNPSILAVHELYIRAFRFLWEFPIISGADDNARYCSMLKRLLEDHKDVVTLLAEGFRESQKHLNGNVDFVTTFLNKTLTSRLAIRLLAEHHLALMEARASGSGVHRSPGHVGVFKSNLRPAHLVTKRAEVSKMMCEMRYGRSPDYEVEMLGPPSFVHIPQPIDYIVGELLKNSFRAVTEHYWEKPTKPPPIKITIVNNKEFLNIKISDCGGGVPLEQTNDIWDYLFTTADADDNPATHAGGIFGSLAENRGAGPMHGYGFGLPTSRAYARYLGGDLTCESIHDYGTDTYLRIAHIDNLQMRI